MEKIDKRPIPPVPKGPPIPVGRWEELILLWQAILLKKKIWSHPVFVTSDMKEDVQWQEKDHHR